MNLQYNPKWVKANTTQNTYEAILLCMDVLEDCPTHKNEIYQKIGNLYYHNLKDMAKARTAFTNALSVDKHDTYTLYLMV